MFSRQYKNTLKHCNSIGAVSCGKPIQRMGISHQNPVSSFICSCGFKSHGAFEEGKRYSDIVQIYDEACIHEPYEEGMHIFFLEALIELKQLKNALSHYNYITSRMYQEFSIEPTPALKNIYNRIVSHHNNNRFEDLLFLGRSLCEDDKMEGALYCEIDYFKTIFNFERRQSLRTECSKFLGLISVIGNKANISKQDREKAVRKLEQLLFNCLKR